MTIKELQEILSKLPEETNVLIEENEVNDIQTVMVQYHSDGTVHVILSVAE